MKKLQQFAITLSLVICALNIQAHEMPPYEFPGGITALQTYLLDNLEYPEIAREEGTEGEVKVSFRLDEEGNAVAIRIEEGLSPACDQAVLRLMKNMPNWKKTKLGSTDENRRISFKVKFQLEI